MKAFPSVKKVKVYADKFGVIDEKEEIKEGMDLRDYFAAKAMQAIITRADDKSSEIDEAVMWVGYYSYQIADAMMKAREE